LVIVDRKSFDLTPSGWHPVRLAPPRPAGAQLRAGD